MDSASLILEQILEMRNKLENLVCLNGLSSPKVLKYSQELDKLIYQLQILDLVNLKRNDLQNFENEEIY